MITIKQHNDNCVEHVVFVGVHPVVLSSDQTYNTPYAVQNAENCLLFFARKKSIVVVLLPFFCIKSHDYNDSYL